MELLLPEKVADLTAAQKGWLTLSHMKAEAFTELQKAELEIQEAVKGYEADDLAAIQPKLTTAKTKVADAKARRLHFTNMLKAKLIDPSMEFEKRSEELIEKVAVVELQLRKTESDKITAANNKNSELARLKAHITNEHQRIGTIYKNELTRALAGIYATALTTKVKPKDIPQYVEASKPLLTSIQLVPFVKFNRILVNDDEAKAANAEIVKYNPAPDFTAAMSKLSGELFEMYGEDFKNADAAAEATLSQVDETIAAAEENFEIESATNTLMAQAAPLTLTGGPVVKKKQKIILEDSEVFAQKILATFIKNWPVAIEHIGVKSFTKLVDPFTKALDKMETTFEGLKTEEICK